MTKRIVRCIGRRYLEIERLPNGQVSISIMWKETEKIATLVFESEEIRKMWPSANTILKGK